ncbi:hypothetical protein VNO80_18889 [Phaseolus coccineus]|uniref:non-specific serine/threonine protein kinase n=1 Tax=Phaseolus coccineus TaxID=3886 RepID=A0AAN9MFF9_PHACN
MLESTASIPFPGVTIDVSDASSPVLAFAGNFTRPRFVATAIFSYAYSSDGAVVAVSVAGISHTAISAIGVAQSPPVPTAASQPPPFPYATAPSTTSIPPFAVAPSPPSPTANFPPAWPDMPLAPEAVTTSTVPPPPLPSSFTTEPTLATPWSPALPFSAPEVNLPVAVDFRKASTFHVSSGLNFGLVIGAIVLVFVFSIGLVLCRNRKKNKQKNLCTQSHVIRVPLNPALPSHPTSESNLLGEGGFGYVYKGVLPCGKQIAVKQLKSGSQQGEREFQAEVKTISRVRHKHLVELVGYCVIGAERMLVYEFVPNNTLEFHLHGKSVIYVSLLLYHGAGNPDGRLAQNNIHR